MNKKDIISVLKKISSLSIYYPGKVYGYDPKNIDTESYYFECVDILNEITYVADELLNELER